MGALYRSEISIRNDRLGTTTTTTTTYAKSRCNPGSEALFDKYPNSNEAVGGTLSCDTPFGRVVFL
jgi:hypothetical protein